MHSICECLSENEAREIGKVYRCLTCSNVADKVGYLKQKITNLNLEIEHLLSEQQEITLKHGEASGKVMDEMGERERKLNLALKEMNVVRQAYHSNSFVGNHCKIMLENYKKLCECLKRAPKHSKFLKIFEIFDAPRLDRDRICCF